MMATRVGDFVTDICNFGFHPRPGPFVTGSMNTFTNNKPQVRQRDRSLPGVALTGSRRRFTNNRPTVRIKDRVVCGIITQSSFNTFIF